MNKRAIFIITILVFSLALTGCSTIQKKANASSNELNVTGRLECKEVDVSSKIPGKIIKMHVAEGMEVKKGQLLLEVNPEDLEIKKLQAEAAVKAAEAQLNKAIQGARAQQINQAQAQLAQAEAQVELLQQKYDRYLPLYEAEALPKDQFDELETKLKVAQEQEILAREQLELVLEGAQKEDILALEAQLEGAKAKLKEVLINLEETEVVAPVNGYVSLVICEEGELVGSGMPIVTITDYADKWVEVDIYETEMSKVKIGQSAEITSKAFSDKQFTGKVISINKNPDFATAKSTNELNDQDVVSYAVKIKIDETEEQLYPGMLVDVTLLGNEG